MKRSVKGLAIAGVLAASVGFATSAAANSCRFSVGVPGVAFGASNYGGYVSTYPAPYYYAPAPVYYGPTYYVPPAGVVYYGPYHHHYYRGYSRPYYRHW